MHLLRSNESISLLPGSEHTWVRAEGNLHDGLYPSEDPLYLYYQVKKPLAGIPAAVELEELVTEVDVQYGEAKHVAWGFSKSNIPVADGREGNKPRQGVWVTYRKGMNRKPIAAPHIDAIRVSHMMHSRTQSSTLAFLGRRQVQNPSSG